MLIEGIEANTLWCGDRVSSGRQAFSVKAVFLQRPGPCSAASSVFKILKRFLYYESWHFRALVVGSSPLMTRMLGPTWLCRRSLLVWRYHSREARLGLHVKGEWRRQNLGM